MQTYFGSPTVVYSLTVGGSLTILWLTHNSLHSITAVGSLTVIGSLTIVSNLCVSARRLNQLWEAIRANRWDLVLSPGRASQSPSQHHPSAAAPMSYG